MENCARRKHQAIDLLNDIEFIKMIAKTVTVFNRGEVLMEDTIGKVLADQRVKDVYLGMQVGGVTL